MSKKIKFICHYDIKKNSHINRNYALSAVNKIDYLVSLLNVLGYNVEIISLSSTRNPKSYKGEKISYNNNLVRFFFSVAWKTKIHKFASNMYMRFAIFTYLLLYAKRNETVFVYHSMQYSKILYLIKKVKRLKFILELEELYSDVVQKVGFNTERSLISRADYYILSTEGIREKLGLSMNKSIIYYGPYNLNFVYDSNNSNYVVKKEFSDKIKIIYSGTFDIRKGVLNAIEMALYLNEDYSLSILGFGTSEEIKLVKSKVLSVQSMTKCKIVYVGKLIGAEYYNYLSQCDVGINPQAINNEFNNTSFPSKILAYLACQLNVITTDLKEISDSDLSNILHFSKSDSPRDLASAILKMKLISKEQIKKHLSIKEVKLMSELNKILDERGDLNV